MEPMTAAGSGSLEWLQSKPFDRTYELRGPDRALFATLKYASPCGSLASAVSAHGCWTFKRVGFFNMSITVREAGDNENCAVFRPRMLGGGALEIVDGQAFKWETANFWGTRWAFADEGGSRVVSFSPGVERPKLSDAFKTQAQVQIRPEGLGMARLALLVCIGWYLLVLRQEETAVVAATTAAAAAA